MGASRVENANAPQRIPENEFDMKYMISVVVPVYNVERYLGRCLDSIFCQELGVPFEVIAVNDGTTDGSLGILEEYARRYDNLVIVDHGSNRSLAVARRTGIERARGYYVMHVDSDDWINPGAFCELLQVAEKEGYPDVIVFNDVRNDGVKVLTGPKIREYSRVGGDGRNDIQHLFFGACVNKMVKRSLLDDLVYGSVYQNLAEDLIYSAEVLARSSSFVLTPSVYYNYFWNGESLSESMSPEKYIKSRTELFRLVMEIRRKYADLNESWLVRMRDWKIDRDTLRYMATHHLSDDKVSRVVFSEFEEGYNLLFAGQRNALDVGRLYDDRIYLMRVLSKSVGWVNVFKRIVRSRVTAFPGS